MFQRILALFIALMSMVVVASAAVIVWFLVIHPSQVETARTPIIPDWVAITSDGELQLHHNGYTHVLRDDAVVDAATLPVISPDGTRVAYVRQTQEQITLSVFVLANETLIDVYPIDDAVVRMVHWSPNSAFIAVTSSDGAVMVVSSDGTQPAVKVAYGELAFVDWSPTSTALLVRLGLLGRDGGLLGVYDVAQQRIVMSHSDVGDFQSAQWDQTGSGYYYVVDAGLLDLLSTPRSVIRYQRLDGVFLDIVDEGEATIRLLPAPQRDQLAYIASNQTTRVLRIWRNGTIETISENSPLTAWWSPDGQMLATLTIVDDEQLRWEVIDVTTGETSVLSTFAPNERIIDVLRYFDGTSFSPWSSDGRWLLTTTQDIVQAQAVAGGSVVPLGPGIYAQWMLANLVR